MADMSNEEIKTFLETRLRELLSVRFAHLSEANLNIIINKAVNAALAGNPNLRVRFGQGGIEGGGRLSSEIKIVISELASARAGTTGATGLIGSGASRTTSAAFVEDQQLEQLRTFVKKLFNDIGKGINKVYSNETVDKVIADLKSNRLNPASYKFAGGPASGYAPLMEEVERIGIDLEAKGEKTVFTGTGSKLEVSERELAVQEKLLKVEAAREQLITSISSKYPKMAQELNRLDPKFLDRQTKDARLKMTTDSYTGSQITKASYQDDMGIIQQATVVVDKYGDVVATTTNRHASFFQGVARDVREFAKWSVAIALVYTPMQKLKELIDVSIKSQTLLADTIVTLGESQEATSMIFESAANIASETGESILGVIEGYNLALRAAGDAADATERYRIANQLLTDSITLSKLSTLSQAESTDVLVAALKQTGTELDKGQDLLDKWVKVTRVANVDLTTLAVSFSIVGEAASKAGLDIDELNGLIALMASQTGLSAKETGNAVRSLISGYTSEPVTKELGKFGIAVKDMEGDARTFQAVMTDIKEAFEAQLISESQLNRIAYQIGGGNRRQAQVVTSIVNLDTMTKVAAESAIAHGESQRALGIELDTVATKSTLLSNSFVKLGQTLGMEGGALAGISRLLDMLTKVSEILVTITGLLGTAGPVLAAFGIGSFLTKGNRGFVQGAVGKTLETVGILGGATGSLAVSALSGREALPGMSKMQTWGAQASQTGIQTGVGLSTWGMTHSKDLGNYAAIAMMAGLRAAKGDWEGFGVTLAAGIGAGLAGKSSTWGAIGATIASVYVAQVEKTLNLVGKQRIGGEGEAEEAPPEEAFKSLIKLLSEQSGRPEWLIGSDITLSKLGQNLFGGGVDLNETEIAIALADVWEIPLSDLQKTLKEIANRGFEDSLGIASTFTEDVRNIRAGGGGINISDVDTDTIFDKYKTNLRKEFYDPTQSMSSAAFKRRLEMLTGMNAAITNWTDSLTVAGTTMEDFGSSIDDSSDLYELFTKIIVYGTDDQIESMNLLSSAIKDVYNELAVATDPEKIEELKQELDELHKSFVDLVPVINTQIDIERASIPEFQRFPEMPLGDFNKTINSIDSMASKYKEALNPDELKKFEAEVKNLEKIIVLEGDLYKRITGEQAYFFNDAKSELERLGELTTDKKLGIQSLDLTIEQLPQLIAEIARIRSIVTPLGYVEETEESIVRFSDDQYQKMNEDQTLLQLALQELIDVNKKQLEGIYNLPANGSFWVPFQAREIEPGSGGSGATAPVQQAAETVSTIVADVLTPEIEQRLKEEEQYGWFQVPKAPEVTPSDIDRWSQDPMMDTYQKRFEEYLKMQEEEKKKNAWKDLYWFQTPQDEQTLAPGYDMYKDHPLFQAPEDKGPAWLPSIVDFFSKLFAVSSKMSAGGTGVGMGAGIGPYDTDFFKNKIQDSVMAPGSTAVPGALQKLNLNITSNVNLRLDGRIVANVVKRYLGESLLRYSTSSGSNTRSVIV